jgi:putative membrane protein
MRTLYRTFLAATVAVPVILLAQSKTPAPVIDDAAIVGIFDIANTWDIETGSLASTRSTRTDVKDFGAMLARDHKIVQDSGRALATKLKVTPTPVAADFPLKVQHEAAMKKLQGLSGAAFDQAFLEHEVAYHKAVIDAVNKSFLPAIKSVELKAFVTKIAPAFVAHQVAAEQLLKKQPVKHDHQ